MPVVSAQAVLAFRGSSYSPPGLAGTIVAVSQRLGQHSLDIATANRAVLARHPRDVDGAGVPVRDTVP